MKKLPLIVIPLLVGVSFALTGCPLIKPAIKTANNLAYDLCVAEHAIDGEKMKLSAEDIGKMFCATEEALKPFLDAILSAKAKLHEAPSASVSASVVLPPVVLPPVVSASASVAPVVSAKPAVSAAPKGAKK